MKFSLYKNKGAELTSLCPWVLMVEDGTVLLKNGALSCSYEFTAPDLDSSSASKIAGIANLFNSSIMQLGEGWALQFHLHRRISNKYPGAKFDSVTGYLIERQREINFSYLAAHYENRYYLTFTYQLPPEIQQKSAGFFYKSDGKNGVINRGLFANQLKHFKMETAKITGILGQHIAMARLDSDGLATFLHKSVSLKWHPVHLPQDYTLFLDRVLTDDDVETSMPLRLGDNYIPIITVKSFPGKTIPAMFDALNNAGCELRWSIRFITYSKETAIKKIDKAEKKFHSNRKSLGQQVMESVMKIESTREDSGAHAQESDASVARQEVTMNVCGFGDYISTVQVWDTDYQKAEEKAKYIAGVIGSCGFPCKEETHNALQAWLSYTVFVYLDNPNEPCNPHKLGVAGVAEK